MTIVNCSSGAVSIGIDAAVVAAHQVAVRGPGVRDDFGVAPTLAGLAQLTERLCPYAGSLVVAEPTAGTWLPLSVAVTAAGCRIGFVANRDSARLRQAIAGANKTDVIDAALLAGCEEILGVSAQTPLGFGQIGLRRAMRRRHVATVAAHRAECRLWALAAWAFPDLWRACGGHRVAQPVLRRWAHLGALSRAHLDSITDIVTAHSRDRQPQRRAERIRDGARGWLRFWSGHLDVDALAWEVCELLDDIAGADETIERAARHASVDGGPTGPVTCCCPCLASGPSARRLPGPGGGRAPSSPRPRKRPLLWASTPPTGSPVFWPRRPDASPRPARLSCAWPTTRPPTWPANTTPNWPPPIGG
jgi:hypothetical protein